MSRTGQIRPHRIEDALKAATQALECQQCRPAVVDKAMLLAQLKRIQDILSGRVYFDYGNQEWLTD